MLLQQRERIKKYILKKILSVTEQSREKKEGKNKTIKKTTVQQTEQRNQKEEEKKNKTTFSFPKKYINKTYGILYYTKDVGLYLDE